MTFFALKATTRPFNRQSVIG